jgi:hypothetical protein
VLLLEVHAVEDETPDLLDVSWRRLFEGREPDVGEDRVGEATIGRVGFAAQQTWSLGGLGRRCTVAGPDTET